MIKENEAGAIIFYEEEGKFYFLLLKYPRYWGLPKGHIEFGEEDLETAKREIKEETGLDVKILPGFKEKTMWFFMRQGEKILREVTWFLAKAESKNVKISEEHEDFAWLPYEEARERLTYDNDKNLLDKAMRYLMKRKGFTIIEILTVLSILIFLWGAISFLIRPQISNERIRDQQRLADLRALELAIFTYLRLDPNPDLDGDNYQNSGKDESAPKMFISIPFTQIDLRATTTFDAGKTWSIAQSDDMNLRRTDGSGWIPIPFKKLDYAPIFALPIDPINQYKDKLFYTYVFHRANKTFEINAKLESAQYKLGGVEDQTSNDAGDNDNLFEVGSQRDLMTNGLY
jgi:bis(5'-nucleosidyl)-tetraphosphatase